MKNQDENISIIKRIYPELSAVYEPEFGRRIHKIYIIETGEQKLVCRFENELTAKHNLFVSQQLNSSGIIKVPEISICNCGKTYCEIYPFIPGKTFHERLTEGLSEDAQDSVYQQIFDISYKISQIPYNSQFKTPITVIAKCASNLFNFFNIKNKKIYHTDLHAKNIILNDEDNVFALIDLDAVYPEYFSLVLTRLIRDAKKYEYNVDKLKKFYENEKFETGILDLEKQMKIYSVFQKTFRFFINDCMYKQLLKISIK